MRKRILVAILSVTALAIVMFAAPLLVTVQRFVNEDATLRLERQATRASLEVPESYLQRIDPVELPPGSDGAHLGLYDPAGQLVAGFGPPNADATATAALTNRVTDTESRHIRIVAVPVTANEKVIGAIRAEQPTATTNRRMLRIGGLILALAGGVIGFGAVIAFVVADRLARPVLRLSEAAKQLGGGDFTIDMAPSSIPELEQARLAMDETAGRLADLVQRERAFSADASHQLRTPLTGLRTAIEAELAAPRDDQAVVLREALDDVERLEATINDLLAVARAPSGAAATSQIHRVLMEVSDTWHGRFATAGRRLVVADDSLGLQVRGNTSMLKQALDVLLDNALVHGAGMVRVAHHHSSETVTISVSDEGPGLTNEPPRNPPADDVAVEKSGHGMGLPLAQRLIGQMPGRLVLGQTGPNPRIDIVLSRNSPANTAESQQHGVG